MSGYTSGNKAPTLMKQSPNRVGNASTREASHFSGVTAVTRPEGSVAYSKGHQGAPSYSRATDNTKAGATSGRGQKVAVSMPKQYDGKATNNGYMARDGQSWLK